MSKSCYGCPSFETPGDSAVRYGKSVGAPTCRLHGHVLGVMGESDEARVATVERFAASCPDHGKALPLSVPVRLSAKVVTADAGAIASAVTQRNAGTPCPSSCNGCQFLAPETIVYQDLKWTAPLCKTTGRLILEPSEEANGCAFGVIGEPTYDVGDVSRLPVYGADPNKVNLPTLSAGDFDPATYVSDFDVSDNARAVGIRAWRNVEDPDGYGKPLRVPIFDIASFDPVERAKVPTTGDHSHPELFNDYQGLEWDCLVEWFGPEDKVPLLNGQAGLGKTEFARSMAWKMGIPFNRINFSKSSDEDDMLGMWTVMQTLHGSQTEMVWKNGRLPDGYVTTSMNLYDEPNRATEVVQEIFLPMMDNVSQLVLERSAAWQEQPDGTRRLVTPPPLQRANYSFTLMAINPAWDTKYSGTMELDQALVSRVSHIEVHTPPRDVERDILITRFHLAYGELPSSAILNAVLDTSDELRRQIGTDDLPISWGVRENIDVMLKTPYHKMLKCYMKAIGDYLEPQTRTQVADIVKQFALSQ